MVAFDGLLSVTLNVSKSSSFASALTSTRMVKEVEPSSNVNVPDAES